MKKKYLNIRYLLRYLKGYVIIMFDVKYKGLRIEPTLAATRELIKYGKDLYNIIKILEDGYDCGTKRKQNIIEKCLRKGSKEFKAVVAKTEVKYPDGYIEDVWRLIHFGAYTYKRRRSLK